VLQPVSTRFPVFDRYQTSEVHDTGEQVVIVAERATCAGRVEPASITSGKLARAACRADN